MSDYTPNNNPYIPGDPYSYDLKWMVSEIKRALNLYDTLDAAFADLTNNFTELYNYFVDNFPAEVHTQILALINDGTMTQIVSQLLEGVYTPAMFGAKGDGVTDDSAAFSDCVAACISDNALLHIPANNKILLSSAAAYTGIKRIKNEGEIIAPSGLSIIYDAHQTGAVWELGTVTGSLKIAGLKASFIDILECQDVELWADNDITEAYSNAYNVFKLGEVTTLKLIGYGSGWINENVFIGGRIVNLTLDGNYGHNNNHFYNNCFEDAVIDFKTGFCNYIHNARLENAVSVTFAAKTYGNFVNASYVGYAIPYHFDEPSYWHDDYGKNFFSRGENDPIKTFRRIYTKDSMNYVDASKMYPSGNKLHNVNFNASMFETPIMPIDKAIGVYLRSDAVFFRVNVWIYDENMSPITTEPANSPVRAGGYSWATDHYYFGNNDSYAAIILSRYELSAGGDSGAAYARISVNGYGTADLEYFEAQIYVNAFSHINAVFPERLTSSTTPTGTDWPAGTIAYNTGGGTTVGWYFDGTTWASF